MTNLVNVMQLMLISYSQVMIIQIDYVIRHMLINGTRPPDRVCNLFTFNFLISQLKHMF